MLRPKYNVLDLATAMGYYSRSTDCFWQDWETSFHCIRWQSHEKTVLHTVIIVAGLELLCFLQSSLRIDGVPTSREMCLWPCEHNDVNTLM
jgi:hypothetical protein